MNILGSYSWYVSIGLDNDLLLIWCQAIIETIDNPAPFHYMCLLDLDDSIQIYVKAHFEVSRSSSPIGFRYGSLGHNNRCPSWWI